MSLKIVRASIPDVLIIEPQVFGDSRGLFLETYSRKKYYEAGLDCTFVQDNYSNSSKDVLRGLHYQLNYPQAKLVHVLKGRVFDVAVDIRRGSPTFGRYVGEVLSAENHRQMFIPEGFAHGFCVLSDRAAFYYKCTGFYHSEDDMGISWADETAAVSWPVTTPFLSDKDLVLPMLKDIPENLLPMYRMPSD